MPVRFYLVPAITVTAVTNTATQPKYFPALGVRLACVEYGVEPTYLVAADVTTVQHATVAANSDVIAVPQNLDNQVGGNLATVQAALESVNLPGSWVQANHTYRQVLQGVYSVMKVAQRLWTLHQVRWFDTGITLDTTIGDLTVTQRNRLQSVADSLGLDYSSVTLATTMRQVLRLLAQQLPIRGMMGELFQAAA